MAKIIPSIFVALVVVAILAFPAYAEGPVQTCGSNPANVLWRVTAPLQDARFGIAATGTDTHLYAIGGTYSTETYSGYPNEILNTVEYSTITADGSLSQWQTTSTLRIARANAAAAATRTHVYVAGGRTSTFVTTISVDFALINADGSLGPWQETTPMNSVAAEFDLVIINNYLYAVDDWSVQRSTIHTDGSLGTWESLTAPTQSYPEFQAVTSNGHIYALSSRHLYGGTGEVRVESAALQPDGTLEAWNLAPTSQLFKEEFDAAAVGDSIFAIGGVQYYTTEFPYVEWVTRMPVNPNGSLGDWEIVNRLNVARFGPSVAATDRYIYAIGGRSNQGTSPDRNPPSSAVEYWDATKPSVPANYGLSINDGDLFTNQVNVNLTIGAVPPWTDKIQVSNNGDFAGATWEPYVVCKPWQITEYYSHVLPRIVYVRYKNAQGNISSLYQDDIILDMNPPMGSIEVLENGAQVANRDVHLTNTPSFSETIYLPMVMKSPTWMVTLRLTASDDISGVAQMMISNNSNFAGATWESYEVTKEWYQKGPMIYAKFKDYAGNVSGIVSDTIPQ